MKFAPPAQGLSFLAEPPSVQKVNVCQWFHGWGMIHADFKDLPSSVLTREIESCVGRMMKAGVCCLSNA